MINSESAQFSSAVSFLFFEQEINKKEIDIINAIKVLFFIFNISKLNHFLEIYTILIVGAVAHYTFWD